MRHRVVGEAACHAGAADASERPKEVLRGAWWSTARSILRRGHAGDDVVATCAQEVAAPSTTPARRVSHVGQDPSVSRRSFAAPVFARLDSGYRHARDGRKWLSACRPCRMSELEKLTVRIEKLERTLRELSERIDASSRKRHTQQVNQPGSGGTVNVSGGSIEGNAHISFGEGSTMNNYLLDRLIDECWPDTPS